jgi:hypothetical protein
MEDLRFRYSQNDFKQFWNKILSQIYREIYQQNHSFIEEIIKLKRISVISNSLMFIMRYNAGITVFWTYKSKSQYGATTKKGRSSVHWFFIHYFNQKSTGEWEKTFFDMGIVNDDSEKRVSCRTLKQVN